MSITLTDRQEQWVIELAHDLNKTPEEVMTIIFELLMNEIELKKFMRGPSDSIQ